MSFLRNVWYAAGWSDELAPDALLARTIADVPVLFYRLADGSAVALLDRCPHRLAPLSLGQRTGNAVRCGYHGLEFGPDGRCVHNPHGPVLSALQVPAYATAERHGLLWVWLGEPAAAAADDIPDLSMVDPDPPTGYFKGYLPTRANHQLLVDNILDLTHADYLHPATLGGGSMTRTTPRVESRGDRVFVQWLAPNERAIPVFRHALPEPDMPTDTYAEVLWYPGGAMHLSTGATAVGAPREAGIVTHAAHIMTPETATTTHYFYAAWRNYATDDADYHAAFEQGVSAAFAGEDKPMIEAQQRRIGVADIMDLKPVLLGIDRASVTARRIFDRLLAAEATSCA